MTDVLGWVATSLFVVSYFAKKRKNLLLLQVAAAFLWIAYGVLLRAAPVIVANVMVASAAAFTALRTAKPSATGDSPASPAELGQPPEDERFSGGELKPID
jgi:hypothetical protein